MSAPRYDVITIFPEYLSPLSLSLIGKAEEKGLLSTQVTDLRTFANGVHKSVDDTPYGGGAGMVMSPIPWGEAIDAIAAQADLAGLASRLTPPSGWSYQVRTLTSPLHVLTTTPSVEVLQDDLNNSYSRQTSG